MRGYRPRGNRPKIPEARPPGYDRIPEPSVPGPYERAQAAYEAMPEAERKALDEWIGASIEPARASYGWDGRVRLGILTSRELAARADVTNDQMRGALLAAGYGPTLPTRAPPRVGYRSTVQVNARQNRG